MADDTNQIIVKFISDIRDFLSGNAKVTEQLKQTAAQTKSLGVSAKDAAGGYNTALVAALNASDAPLKNAENNAKNVMHANAGVTRELIVLGREVASGNFARLPGSLAVLASRAGFLNISFLAMAGSIVAVISIFGKIAEEAEHAAEGLNKFQLASDGLGKGIVPQGLVQLEDQLRRLPGLSRDSADSIITTFARAHDISGNKIADLTHMVYQFAQVTGKDPVDAAKIFADSLSNVKDKVDDLEKITNYKLNPAQMAAAKAADEAGQHLKAQNIVFDELRKYVDGLNVSLTKTQVIMNDLAGLHIGEAFKHMIEGTGKDNLSGNARDLVGAPAGVTPESNAKGLIAEQETAKRRAEWEKLTADSKKTAQSLVKDAQSEYQDKVALAKQVTAYRIEQFQVLKDAGKLTLQQQVDLERVAYQQEYQLELNALKQKEKVLKEGTQAFKTAKAQEALLAGQYNLQLLKLDDKLIQGQKQKWSELTSSIKSSFSSSIAGMINGTMTFGQAFTGVLNGIGTAFANMIANQISGWLEAQIFGTTSATTEAMATITAHSAEAAAAAYASTAAIPVIGPELAPAAAAKAKIETLAFSAALPGFAQGAYRVPGDMTARIHKDEMILPKPFADDVRSGKSLGGGGDQYHVTIHATDAKSVQNLLKDNSGIIAQIVKQQARNFNPNLRKA